MAARHSPERRLTFGSVAELYEQTRPSYPSALVDDVIVYAGLHPGGRILEVGAGTGKATRLFAAGGYEIVALEPSAEMATVARTTCRSFPLVSVVEAEFERFQLPPAPFTLVMSAQAWHWIDPEVRYVKARAALSTGGALAVFWNHADWQQVTLRSALDEAYRQAAPDFAPSGPMHPLTERGDLVPDWEAEITEAHRFEQPTASTYSWRARYSAEEYVALVSTHSDHIVLEPRIRERLLERIGATIDEHGGELEIHYVTVLGLARAA